MSVGFRWTARQDHAVLLFALVCATTIGATILRGLASLWP
jgi:hypothetical protein